MFKLIPYLSKPLLGLVFLCAFAMPAKSAVWVVDDLGDPGLTTGGTLNLRTAIASAGAGDTIVFNVRGTITLTAGMINISNPITIFGAEPIHTIIDCNGDKAFRFTGAGSTSYIDGMTITNGATSLVSEGILQVEAGVQVTMDRMVIANNNGRGLYNNGGIINMFNTSFINNTSSVDGAAIYTGNNGVLGCTTVIFGDNIASGASHGGAIYAFNGSVALNHVTFFQNTAGGLGGAIQNWAASVTFTNTCIADNNQGGGGQFSLGGGGPSYTSGGNNFYKGTIVNWTPLGSDIVNAAGFTGMANTPLTNGWGYMFYPILTNGILTDNGASNAGIFEDIRRAPRALDADFDAVPEPDIGAVEYTQFRVETVIGTDDMWDIYTQVTTTGNAPPYFISFDIPGGPHIIDPFVDMVFPDQTIIDGYQQPGSRIAGPGDPGNLITPAEIYITLDGSFSGLSEGITFGANNSEFSICRGMGFINYQNALVIDDDDIQVSGCHIGFDNIGNMQSNDVGLRIGWSANSTNNALIGGPSLWDMNVISGNITYNILIGGGSGNNHIIYNNFIGTTTTGDAILDPAQSADGIYHSDGVGHRIGNGPGAFSGNVISGNKNGIVIPGVASAVDTIQGNFIGLEYGGNNAVPNAAYGISMYSGTSHVLIGGSDSPSRNYISGNGSHGIYMNNIVSNVNIQGNYIGLDEAGVAPVGNTGGGIYMSNTISNNVIGGNAIELGNVISNNGGDGIYLAGPASDNTIYNNFIGTDAAGFNQHGNTGYGILITAGATGNLVGGANIGNLICDNTLGGIRVSSAGSDANNIVGNFLGMAIDGTTPLGNSGHGISITNAGNMIIGGTAANSGNFVAESQFSGIHILNAGSGITVQGNFIGTDGTGDNGAGNGANGIYVNNASPVQIGGPNAGEGNFIIDNGTDGIYLDADNCSVAGNFIGLGAGGNNVGNGGTGIYVLGSNNAIGGTGTTDGNIIANNADDGVRITGAIDDNNSILQNLIYNNGSTANHLGIDLGTSGVNANDVGDVDADANDGQNYPDLHGVTTNCNGTATRVAGELNSTPLTDFRIEFFVVDAANIDPSGYGEAPVFFDFVDVTTDAAGYASFLLISGTPLTPGDMMTSTATRFNAGTAESTSEFSGNVPIENTVSFTGFIYTQDPLCNGDANGQLWFQHQDGTGPYTYAWSHGETTDTAFSVAGGNPTTVTVTDSLGCSATSSPFTLTDPSLLNLTVGATSSPSCNGLLDGFIILSGTGGTGALQYSIDGGITWQAAGSFTGLGPGTYIPMVMDANGCTDTGTTVTLINPPLLAIIQIATTDVTCNGGSDGSITITASGGTGALSYSIDNGISFQGSNTFTGLSAGTYDVVVQDANLCTVAWGLPIAINEPSVVTHSTANTNENCSLANGQIIVSAAGGTGAPYQYSIDGGLTWVGSGIFNGLSAGTYQVIVQDGLGCTSVVSNETLINIAPHTIDLIMTTGVSCNGAGDGTIDITVSGGIPPYNYSIDNGVTFQTSNLFTGLSGGTFMIVVTDGNNLCPVNSTATVTEPAPLTVTTTGTDASCNGFSDGTATVTVSGGTPGYSFNWTPIGGTNATATGLPAGTYSIWVDDANGCGPVSDTYIVNEPSPLLVFNSATPPSCGMNNGSITLNGAGGDGGPYQFTIDNGVTWQGSGSFTNLAPGTYQIASQDGSGCTSNTGTFNLNAVPPPTFANITLTHISCNGFADGVVDVTGSGGLASQPYSINGGAFQVSGNFPGLSAGTHTISIIDTMGCQVDSTVTLNEPTVLSLTQVNSFDPGCNGVCDGQLQVVGVTGGTPAYQYSIDGITYGGASSFAGLCAGIYTVYVQDANGCVSSMPVTLTDPPVENAGFFYPQSQFCLNSGVWTPMITGTPGGQFTVNQAGVAIDTMTGSLDLNATTYTGAAIVSYTTPCGVTGNFNVDIDPVDDPSFNYAQAAYCQQDPDPSANITGGASGTFSSSSAGLVFLNTTTGLIDVSASTPGNYWIIFNTSGICPAVDSFNVSIASTFTPLIDNTVTSMCLNNGTYTYTANPPGGAFSGGIYINAGGVFDPLIAGPGMHWVVYTIGTGGCQGIDSLQVTVYDVPTITLSGGGNYCAGDTPPEIYVSYDSGQLPVSYDVYESTNFITNITSSNSMDTFVAPGPGTYFAQNITDANGCMTVASNNSIDVIEVPLPPAPTMVGGGTYCLGDSIPTLLAQTAVGQSSWYADAGLTQLITIGTPYLPTINTAGTYTYYAVVNNNGCTGPMDSVTLVILDAPSTPPTLQGSTINLCQGDPLPTLTATANFGGVINWYDDQFNFLTSGSYTVTNSTPGTYVFYATEALGSCEGPGASVTITIYGGGSVDAGPDVVICPNDSVQLGASGGINYIWLNPAGLSDSTIADPWLNTTGEGYLYVAIETPGNCFFIDSLYVTQGDFEDCGAHAFNAFSPDGDGVNETWSIEGIERYGSNKVTLFNRWGDVLISFTDYNNTTVVWDGRNSSGDQLPSGTYFYVIETNNPNFSSTGWVQLMR